MKAHVIIILFIYLLHYMNSNSQTYTQDDVLIKESISRYMINGKKHLIIFIVSGVAIFADTRR